MGIYLGQQPPAELARLKAELAETLIANFCYPRFFDYRTNTLRMRPIDRSKRQEVWTFLSSFDFGSWNRIDVLSPEFQRQVERLFIQYVQRNRAFFGEQGRKRMSDVRAMISVSSLAVTDGLRGHLTGRRHASHPFGSPRPVVSWSSSTISHDLPWEQISNATMLLQQQLQGALEKAPTAAVENGARSFSAPVPNPAASIGTPPRRSPRNRLSPNGSGKTPTVPNLIQPDGSAAINGNGIQTTPALVRPVPIPPIPRPVPPPMQVQTAPPQAPQAPQAPQVVPTPIPAMPAQGVKTTNPLESPAPVNAAPVAPEAPLLSSSPFATPPAARATNQASRVEDVETQPISDGPPEALASLIDTPGIAGYLQQSMPSSARMLSRENSPSSPLAKVATTLPTPTENATILVNDEDVVIFEQLKYQLTLWLRVEVIHLGMDIADKSPLQLIDTLRSHSYDETRLQVVSTLLHLADSVVANRHAMLVEYKQAMMFYLMHTRNVR